MLTLKQLLTVALLGIFSQMAPCQTTTASNTLDEAIKAKVLETGLKHQVLESGNIRFSFGLDNNRTQNVTIRGKLINHTSGDYLEILTCSGKIPKTSFQSTFMLDLLKKNWDYNMGSWQIAEDSDGFIHVYFGVKAPINIGPVPLFRILQNASDEADKMELSLTQKDDFYFYHPFGHSQRGQTTFFNLKFLP